MPKGPKKKIRFNDNIQNFNIPYEERRGICINYAIDRMHFKRKIEHTSPAVVVSESGDLVSPAVVLESGDLVSPTDVGLVVSIVKSV